MGELIEPRVLKGFRDFLPNQEAERQRIQRILEGTFTKFGFEPIDTPVLEYTEILLGKGGGETDKQVYRFDDQGGRDVAMRFDLTVPFARFMAAHLNEIYLPFKRYHIAKVFRGENTQRGRYREFVQCDFDVVGTDSASADFEVLLLMDRSFRAMGVPDVRIHLAHRGVFAALLRSLGVGDQGELVLRAVDKLRKIGEGEVRTLLRESIGADATDTVIRYVTPGADNNATLALMEQLAPAAAAHTDRLRAILAAAAEVGIAGRLVLDPSITRGLDYYTGVVFETFLNALPKIGSVCSGGRYDDLASLYTKERLPGVGASIGLDRLMAGLEELGVIGSEPAGADAMVLCLDASLLGHYHAVAEQLRDAGLRVDVYPEPRKPGQQYAFAEKKGIAAAVLCGQEERRAGVVTVRDLSTRTNTEGLTPEQAAGRIRELAAAAAQGRG